MQSIQVSNTADITSRNLYPPRVNDMHSMVNLIHSYGWEESKFPDEWVDDFNEYLQGILNGPTMKKKCVNWLMLSLLLLTR